jgi:CelD/BcsL family acetyltransferase involved in cellulose biosynthesis
VSERIAVETIKVSDLGMSERVLWREFRRAKPLLASPYFDLRYMEVAAQFAPGAAVAVIRRGDEIVGFLPFQRRGGAVQPLAAPMSDYHGLIARPDTDLDLIAILRGLGAERARVRGLIGGAFASGGLSVRYAMAADLREGYVAYEAAREAGFLKDKRRRRRALERDHGPVTFSYERPTAPMMERVIADKRLQFRRTHQYDIFACGWTARLLHGLAEIDDKDFGLRLATLRAGDKVVAAELGLTGGDRHHLWFPVYDTAYARYSPGHLMTLETLRVAAGQGISRVDFGAGGEAYKRDFAQAAEPVFEGVVSTRPRALAGLRHMPGVARLSRRFDCMEACEPGPLGRVRGASSFAAAMGRRHPRLGTGIGLGLGLGLSLALLAD